MKPVLSGRWAETPSTQRREPTAPEIASGYPCGPWDLALFNELDYRNTDVQREVGNLILSNGITLSESDPLQVLRAVRKQGPNYYQPAAVSGTANAITLTSSVAPFAAAGDLDGVPLRFVVEAVPTGSVTVAVDGLPALPLNDTGGLQIGNGGLAIGQLIEIVKIGSVFFMLAGQRVPQAGASTNRAPRLVGVRAANSGQSVPTSTNTQITGLTVSQNNLYGTSAFASNALTVGAGEGGVWQLGGFSHFSSGTALGFVSMSIRVNGTQQLISGEGTTGLTAYADLSRPFVLVPGDVVTWWCSQQSGGTIGTLNHQIDAFLVSAV
jgi:hypothetical protein